MVSPRGDGYIPSSYMIQSSVLQLLSSSHYFIWSLTPFLFFEGSCHNSACTQSYGGNMYDKKVCYRMERLAESFTNASKVSTE